MPALSADAPDPAPLPRRRSGGVQVAETAALNRAIIYSPDMDGHAESGEVVWIHLPCHKNEAAAIESPVLTIGRHRRGLLGLLISSNPAHASEPNWLEIGAGSWDRCGQTCWVRLDRVLIMPESDIRRQAVVLPRPRFERVAARLRSDYNWD